MVVALLVLAVLGTALGLVLGIAGKLLAVQGDPAVEELGAMMPGTNCGQCGFAGCAGAAAAILEGKASAACCPPGGKALAQAIAARFNLPLDGDALGEDAGPQLAQVEETLCIGCCKCLKVCGTDALLGAAKQIHSVLREACTGCGECVAICPTEAVRMAPVAVTLPHWVWPRPAEPALQGVGK